MSEPYPASIREICSRCGQLYYISEGCECNDWSVEELEDYLSAIAEGRIDEYEDSLMNIDDELSDEAQSYWENWRTEEW